MISVEVTRSAKGIPRAFEANNHGKSEACAAVSLMVLNTVNSIDALTDQDFKCEYDENGGYVKFSMKKPARRSAVLLIESMLFGLNAVKEQYPDEIEIIDGK
ncbi:MAG: ribosomal-processing cysteine protease Prp [Clostridiales bacterium]|jgi:uncharacterized protein YsxB (DUF464 family)|nr:ribosomal-processing cysteine protease Prp [Clostridiales bacterium]